MNRLKITFGFFILAAAAAGCGSQTVQDRIDQSKQQAELATSPATTATQTEIDAAKDPCDDAQTPEEAEKCRENEYQRVNAEMEKTYAAVMLKLQEKNAADNKEKAEKSKIAVENAKQAQSAWLNYRETHCKAEENAFWRETDAQTAETECFQRLTEQRSEELKMVYLAD